MPRFVSPPEQRWPGAILCDCESNSASSAPATNSMRETGLEPAWYCYRQPLKLVRLPIPPFPQNYEGLART